MASPRPDKTGVEMLRHSLAHELAAAGECPDSEILAAYFERSLDAEETARCELHLSGCARCREEISLLERASRDVAVAGDGTQAVGRRAWDWDWRWLAPTAAALIIAVVWIVQRPSNLNRGSQSQTLVAMSQPSEPPVKELPAPPRTPSARRSSRFCDWVGDGAKSRARQNAECHFARDDPAFDQRKAASSCASRCSQGCQLKSSREIGWRTAKRFRGTRHSD